MFGKYLVRKRARFVFVVIKSILSQFSITVDIFLRVLSYPFFKFKITLGCPKIMIVVK